MQSVSRQASNGLFTSTESFSITYTVSQSIDRIVLKPVTNLFNQHSVVAYYSGLDSQQTLVALHPGYDNASPNANGVNLGDGALLHQILESS